MKYTLGTAAKATGKSKTTIHRAIKSGKISALHDVNGSYEIDPAELHRVFPPAVSNGNANPEMEQSVTHDTPRMLQHEVEMLRERLSEKDRHIDDLRHQVEDTQRDRDHWRQQATYLLEGKQEKEPEKPPEPPQSWFGRLFKRI